MCVSPTLSRLLVLVMWLITLSMDGQAYATQTGETQAARKAEEDEVTQIFELRHIDADTALQIFRALYESNAKLKVEPKSNSLAFRGTKTELESLGELLEELEVRASQPRQSATPPAKVLTIETNTSSRSVAELREQYRTLEQQCLEQAKRLRDTQNTSPQSRQSLAELVDRSFRARQDFQRAEVAENARRLQKIQQTLETREGLKSRIVERRLDELLNPNVDWLKSDVGEFIRTVGEKNNASQREAHRLQSDSSLFNGTAAHGVGVPNPLLETSELLRRSPEQMRELLEVRAGSLRKLTKEFDVFRAMQKDGDTQQIRDALKKAEAGLKSAQKDFQFAKLQYDETIKYLEVALHSAKEQMSMAMEEYSGKAHMFKTGLASQSDVNAVAIRRRELEVELQRVESLLKLYRAAGDIPELAEVRKPSGSTLGFNIGDAKLGVPVWIEGSGGLTTSPGGYAIVSNDQRGLVAQILFSNIPDHENARLMLKVEAPVSVSDALRSRGVGETDWHSVREVSISDAEIQAAIDGKPFRKSYFLRPDGSMVEKDTDSEAAKTEKDPLVATIELAVP